MAVKVFFRADAGADIGYGHFIRSLALADMLKDDFDCTFFTQSPSAYQRKEAETVCPLVALPSDDSRFDLFLEYLTGEEIVVLDNYFYTSEYQKRIKDKGCRLVVIDDIHDRHFHADMIINHGNATRAMYDAEPQTRFCLGPAFAMLRKPFLAAPAALEAGSEMTAVPERTPGRWVVCFGGSDPHDLTGKAAASLSAREDVSEVVAIVGEVYSHRDALAQYDKVKVLTSLSAEEMAAQYRSAEYVLCSASSVSYEALACGCNVFAGYYVDNQVDFYKGLCQHDLISPLGNLLVCDFDIWLHVPRVGLNRMDICGAGRRLLNAFRALELRIVNYVDMTLEESRKAWEVRNLPEIRRCMTRPEPFSFESHLAFVESLRGNASKLYYAVFKGDELIGSYDFVDIRDGESAEHGLYVNPAFHGMGYASVIESVMDECILERGVRRILAEVLKSNPASCRYHLKQGYTVCGEDEKYYYLERYIR